MNNEKYRKEYIKRNERKIKFVKNTHPDPNDLTTKKDYLVLLKDFRDRYGNLNVAKLSNKGFVKAYAIGVVYDEVLFEPNARTVLLYRKWGDGGDSFAIQEEFLDKYVIKTIAWHNDKKEITEMSGYFIELDIEGEIV